MTSFSFLVLGSITLSSCTVEVVSVDTVQCNNITQLQVNWASIVFYIAP